LDDGWEQKITQEKSTSPDNRYINHTGYWATFMTVENSDPKLIDFKEYSTAVQLRVK
jgi:hypothetical protein